MARLLYSLLLYIALPFVALRFLWTGWRDPASRGSLRARLGMGLVPRHDHPLWLHAASVGEVRSLAVLLRQLHRGGFTILLTVGTPTGLAQARQLYQDLERVTPQAAVWDLPGAVRRFLNAVQPNAGLFVETELWPNLLHAAARAGVPLGLVERAAVGAVAAQLPALGARADAVHRALLHGHRHADRGRSRTLPAARCRTGCGEHRRQPQGRTVGAA